MTHHPVMTSSLRIKILKIGKFGDFSSDIEFDSKTDIFRDVISLIIFNVSPRAQKAPPADIKCPPTAQGNQATISEKVLIKDIK